MTGNGARQRVAWAVAGGLTTGLLTVVLGLVAWVPAAITGGAVVAGACAVVLPRTGLSTRIPIGESGPEPPTDADAGSSRSGKERR